MMSSFRRPAVLTIALAVSAASLLFAQQPPKPIFRAGLEIVSVDVIVRDRSGAIVRDLRQEEFEVREDGRPQEVATFSFQEISEAASPFATVDLLAAAEARVADAARLPGAGPPAQPAGPEPPAGPMRSTDLAGRRLIVLLFDISSMQPEEVQRAVESAQKYVETEMSAADLIAVATVSSMLDVLADFTGDRTKVRAALQLLAYTEGTATEPPEASTVTTDETAAAAEETTTSEEAAELELFNNDMRLRALKALAETLAPIEQKKAVLYFSAGMQRGGQDNQVELRAAVNAAVRANLSIYAIDTRGLQAVVPGGDARQASGRGQSLFSGRGMARQFSRLSASQDTLTTLSADTGGRSFTDTNDFGEAFARVRRDLSAYYLLGYRTTNPDRDGRFRRIQVRVKREGLRVEARAGYYADRDFAHTSRSDREAQLEEQLFAAVSMTDLPVFVKAAYFRVTADRYFVPVSVAVPGSAVPVVAGKDKATLEILGMVRDEMGRPVGRIRQTLEVPARDSAALGGRQVLYQSGMELPPGRFGVKFVVRENAGGTMGSFETAVTIPELARAPLKISSVVLSTQLQQAPRGRSANPLVRDGVQLLPNLTHVVSRDQKLFFFYEVYEPAVAEGRGMDLKTSLAFYRGKVKLMETPIVSRTAIDAPDRRAAVFRFELPAAGFEPGLYTCQINVIDDVAGEFAFPRLVFFVR